MIPAVSYRSVGGGGPAIGCSCTSVLTARSSCYRLADRRCGEPVR
jgi:hypothetical protein